MSNVRFSTLQLCPSHGRKLSVGIPAILRMDVPCPAPVRWTPDKTDGLWRPVQIPEAEIRYVPSGTRHVPPFTAHAVKDLINAAVSFVTPSPTAPYSLTLTI